MRTSRFNVYHPGPARVGVFNALSGRWTTFGPAAGRALQQGRAAALLPGDRRRALEIGALVPDDLDEHARYAQVYRQASQDRSTLGLVCVLTWACNLRCPYCFERGLDGAREALAGARLEALLQAARAQCEQDHSQHLAVMLFGGEPLLMPEACERLLSELAGWCHATGRRFTGSLSTNGTLLDVERVRRLAPYLAVAQVTFDGPRDVHDTLRVPPNGQGTYDHILQAIHRLLAAGVAVNVRLQASAATRARLPELVRALADAGLVGHPRVRFTLAALQRFGCRTCSLGDDLLEPGSEVWTQIQASAPDLLPAPTPVAQILPCMMSGNHLCVAPDGALYKCITEVGRAERAVGHLSAGGRFEFDAQHAEFMARDPLSFECCRACALLPLCGGGCPAAARSASGTWLQPDCEGRELLQRRLDNLMGART